MDYGQPRFRVRRFGRANWSGENGVCRIGRGNFRRVKRAQEVRRGQCGKLNRVHPLFIANLTHGTL